MLSIRFLQFIPLSIVLIALGACHTSTTIIEGRGYPTATVPGKTLDIQVVRKSTRIEFTNTTAQAIGPCTMWLNSRYSMKLDGLAVGQTRDLALRDFKDQWGDAFNAGGFFATELSERLAKAEIEPDGGTEMLGLVVVRGEE
jgi:hypothetical protein